MRYSLAMLVLLCAACLEAGGDALIRVGLRSPTVIRTALFIVLGGLTLTAYGYAVNTAPWRLRAAPGGLCRLFFCGGAGNLVAGIRPKAHADDIPGRSAYRCRRVRRISGRGLRTGGWLLGSAPGLRMNTNNEPTGELYSLFATPAH